MLKLSSLVVNEMEARDHSEKNGASLKKQTVRP
jgi:hypothetical protein